MVVDRGLLSINSLEALHAVRLSQGKPLEFIPAVPGRAGRAMGGQDQCAKRRAEGSEAERFPMACAGAFLSCEPLLI